MSNRRPTKLAGIVAKLYLAILALLPLHAFLTTWAGSAAGHLDVWRIWKEVLIFGSSLAVFWLLAKDSAVRQWVFDGWLARLVLVYVAWGVVGGLLALSAGRVNGDALVYGLFADLRFPAFMLLVAVVARMVPTMNMLWRPVVVVPLSIVVIVGLLQLVLPPDFLRHFGYGPHSIGAVQFVDNKPDYPRIQSTLRGPNPLGAYLVLGIAAVIGLYYASRSNKGMKYGALTAGSVVVLGYTYSRSAYLGTALAVGGTVWLLAIRGIWKKRIALAMLAAVVVLAAAVVALRNNDTVQNVVFHSDEHSTSAESSNTGRARGLMNGAYEVLHNPLGSGIGTAGPASVRNTPQPPRIAENYYIQIGQEMGWLGIGLFVALQAVLLYRMWPLRSTVLGAVLLASWCGLTLVNMLSHAWADDTLGLLWWGLAGIALGSIMSDNRKDNRKQVANTQHYGKA